MDAHLAIELTTWLNTLTHWNDLPQAMNSLDWTILAQQFNQDILGDMQKAFDNFIKSGQVWAMVIGFVLGYMLRSATAS